MDRYKDRNRYFQELYETSASYFTKYVEAYKCIPGSKVLEIGCGEGGNLLAFKELGAEVTGLDLSEKKIRDAKAFFEGRGEEACFSCEDFLAAPAPPPSGRFDIIIIHDVIEHIEKPDKAFFFERVSKFLGEGGVIFWGFPAWQMPFGGHQQICRKSLARLPFIHLLPSKLYELWLRLAKVEGHTVSELLSIKRSKMTVESFEGLCSKAGFHIEDRTLWLVNPHYEVKFGLRPRKLPQPLASIPWLRNFLSTSCFYLTSRLPSRRG